MRLISLEAHDLVQAVKESPLFFSLMFNDRLDKATHEQCVLFV